MKANFMDMVNSQLVKDDNVSVTENGAIGYKTTGKKLLDLNFATSSLRKESDETVQVRFAMACAEDLPAAITWLFFARDIRGGMGERRLFRVCMKYLAREFPNEVRKVLPLISEYGRWDDLVDLLGTKVREDVVDLICKTLQEDVQNMQNNRPVTLLAKWLPSENASSPTTKKHAKDIRMALGLSSRSYRLTLSKLRKHIGIVESKMTSNQWDDIDYEAVPSQANLRYNDAFLRHDTQRRQDFLSALEKGEKKINASAAFPHDIVHKYTRSGWSGLEDYDAAIEGMWKALPDYTNGKMENTIVVADGSGSMFCRVGKESSVMAMDVCEALSIYFAEKMKGAFHNRFITFSRRPQLVNLNGANTLRAKLRVMREHDECENTDLNAVFQLILNTAVSHNLKQEDLPKNILVISDMEFDCGAHYDSSLFDEIRDDYAANGYKLPRLIFWNVASRSGTIPVANNDLGVALVSGFSPSISKMVLSGKTDPYEVLIDTLNSDRYLPVRKALLA